ncbi:MAG: hypothetical protein OCC45_05605 [Desulfotalea sp.]
MIKFNELKKNRDFWVIVIIVLFFILIGIYAINHRQQAKTEKDNNEVEEVVVTGETESSVADKNDKSSSTEDGKHSKNKKETIANVGGYITEFKPEDIIKTIVEYGTIDALPPEHEITKMPVGWFVYYVGMSKVDVENARVSFDTLQSGFGATVHANVNLNKFPKFDSIKEGHKVWLAGTIEGVDIQGVGDFEVKPDFIRFDGKTHKALFTEE